MKSGFDSLLRPVIQQRRSCRIRSGPLLSGSPARAALPAAASFFSFPSGAYGFLLPSSFSMISFFIRWSGSERFTSMISGFSRRVYSGQSVSICASA